MRKGVRHRRDAPQPCGAGERRHVVNRDAVVGEIIRADGGAVAHVGHVRGGHDLAGEQKRKRRRGVRGVACGEIIGRDAALAVEAAIHVHELRRALRLPLVFLIARELHPHRPPDRAREQGGVGRDVVRAVAPVAARRLHADDFDRALGKVEQQGEIAAHPQRILRAGPDARAVGADVRERRRGPDRGVHLVGPDILRASGVSPRRESRPRRRPCR